MRTNLFHIVLLSIFLTTGSLKLSAQETRTKSTPVPAEKQKNTLPLTQKKQDSIDPAKEVTVSVDDTIKKKKNGLDGIIKRTAEDYEKVDQVKKELELYNKAELFYKDIELKAGKIIMKYDKDEIFAGRIKDSLGNYSQYPYFKQGNNVVEADSIHFNTKTKKARIWNSRSDQGEFRIKGEITKRENDSVYYIKGARFTTSKNIDNPEYYFYANKIKFVPGKKVVVGPTIMYIADVPTPLGIPFAFFPMSEKAVSGLLIPTFGDNNQQGYYLQNGGYYFALSDYYDLAITGDYYTNGSYGLRFQSSYANRYKYNGNVYIRYENIINGERGLPGYQRAKNYNIQWSHSQDAKANPNSRFAAQVNLGSSKYYRNSLSMDNIGSTMNNTLSSSVTYSKTFQTVPDVNFSIGMTHNQNTNTEVINMTLPTFQASVGKIFPFAPGDGPKKGIFKNINLQYSVKAENRIATTDSLFFKKEMFDNAKIGMQQIIPLSTNFKVFKHFSVTASSTYQENWLMNTIKKEYNPDTKKDTIINLKGFDSFRTYNFSSGVGTTIYGTYSFGDNKKIQAIRHVMRPNVTYTYTPSFDRYYETYKSDATGTRTKEYTRFENGMYGTPSNRVSNLVTIGVNNTIEAKVRNDDENDPDAEPKKVLILNNLSFNTSYDIAKDSIKWAPLRISTGTNLFKEKMNINVAATLDPYAIDKEGRTIDVYNINNGGSLFRLTGANFTLNYAISSEDDKADGKNKDSQTTRNGGREDDLFGRATNMNDSRTSMFDDEDEDTDIEKDKSEGKFFNAKLPWDLRFAYTLTYFNNNRENKIVGNSIMVSGNLDITPRWKMGFSSGYDFVQKGVTFTQLRFERDLLSWRMDFNWVPIGPNSYWGFFIGIKSSVLSDIKYDKRQIPDRQLQ
ncbi:putative LPS assembly protein LptD [Flavobacterium hauense]